MSGHRYQDAAGPPSPSVASPYESAQLPAVDGHYYPPAEPSTPDGLSPPPTLYNQKNDSRGYQPVVSSNYGTKSGSRYSSYNSQSQHPLKNATYADSQTLRGSQEDIKDPKGSFLRGDSAFKRFSGFTVPARTSSTDSEPTPRRKRLGYLDGLKFLAAWVVLNGTLLDNAIPDDTYTAIQRASPLYIFRSTNLGFTALLILSARSLLEPLWDVPAAEDSKGPSINWTKTSRSLLTRPFRFILPVVVIAAIQWGLGAGGSTDTASEVGMTPPAWDQINSWSGFCTLVFDLFSQWFVVDTTTAKMFGANLWFTPWLFDSSYCAYVTHIMLGNLSSNRYWVYGLLWFFSWTSFTFFAVATIGVVICDMAVHGVFQKIQNWPFLMRLALQLTLLAIGLVFQWINVIRDNVNSGLFTISVLGLREVTFCDMIFVTCALLIVETSPWCQLAFGNIVMRMLGKLSAGMVLISPIIVYTIVPKIAQSMGDDDAAGSSVLGVGWLVTFLASFGLAMIFHFVLELPSKFLGEHFAELCTNWGRVTEEEAAIKAANAKAKAGIKAPNSVPAKIKNWLL